MARVIEGRHGNGHVGERLSRLGGGYEHLATKADVTNLKADIRDLENRLIRWMIGGMAVWSAVVISALQLLGG